MSCCESSSRSGHSHQKQWNPALEVLFKHLTTGKDCVKVKEAVEVGTKAVEYFRGQDLPKWVNKNRQLLIAKYSNVLALIGLDENQARSEAASALANRLGQTLIAEGFILRAEHRPIASAIPDNGDADSAANQIPPHLRDSAKWPRRVGITKSNQTFDEAGFFVIVYESVTSWNYLVLAGIIVAVLCCCLFPIWPFRLKIAMWYLGVAFLCIMIFIIILRLVLFLSCWFAGCDFWFLPNFFNEDVGFVDSFIPTYSFQRRNDDWLMMGARAFAAVLGVGAFYKLSETHSFSDVGNVASKGFLDILDWGHQKLSDAPENPVTSPAPVALSPEERKVQDWNTCVAFCEFADFEEFKDFCLSDCECMSELWSSNCWKRCSSELQSDIKKTVDGCEDVDLDELDDAVSSDDRSYSDEL